MEDVRDLFGMLASTPAGALVYPPVRWVKQSDDGDDGVEDPLPADFISLF